jgi:hypothetical protein
MFFLWVIWEKLQEEQWVQLKNVLNASYTWYFPQRQLCALYEVKNIDIPILHAKDLYTPNRVSLSWSFVLQMWIQPK